MRSWGLFSGLLGFKFWKIFRKEGIMETLKRGKIYKTYPHEKGGWVDAVRCVGTDEYGNRFFEDFEHHNFNTGRWVEYSDLWKNFPTTARKVAPGWSGWLHYTYNDIPCKEDFHRPFYSPDRPFIHEYDHPTYYRNPGDLKNPENKQYREANDKMSYNKWIPNGKQKLSLNK